MMEEIEDEPMNTVSAILGKRKTGKTVYVKGDSKLNQPGLIRTYLNKNMKVLIVDTFDHPSYRDIPIIKPEQFAGWKKGCYRIFVRRDKIPQLCALLSEVLWNTLVIFEDAHKHPNKNKLDESIMALIGDSKQKNVDLIFMYHCWSLAPKDLYRYMDYIEVFKTKDHPSCREEDMPGYYDDALKAYNEVKAHSSRYYHKLINTDL